ncbi:MAG: hypothetical protein MI922_22395 [Bacteroidales bacterium]|nr:hypothetical protein [Bacteroidales bacterium]
MKLKNIIASVFLVLLIVLIQSCGTKRNVVTKGEDQLEKEELEYYHLFTEATKHSLLGNFSLSVQLYNKCIQLKPESGASYYQLSNIYMRAGDVNNALSYGESAFRKDNSNIWYALHLANLYQFKREYKKAVEVYERINELANNDEYKYNLALLYSNTGQFENALNLLDTLVEEEFVSKELSILKHNIFHKMGKKDSAVYELENLIQNSPEDFENYGLLAEYLSEIKRNDYAQNVYHKLINMMPDNGLVYISYGDFLKKNLKDSDSAFYYYKRAMNFEDIRKDDKVSLIYSMVNIDNNPDSLLIEDLIDEFKKIYPEEKRIYTVSADFYIKARKYENARNDLERYLDFEKKNEIVWEQYLLLDNFIGNDSTLISNADTAIVLFPKNSKFYLLKAYGQSSLELNDSVKVTASRGLKISEDQNERIQYYNLLADAHRRTGEHFISDSYFEKILELEPGNLMIKNNYSYYLSLRKEKLEYAKKLSGSTIRREPENATYLDTYGWILYQLEEYEEAFKYIKQAIAHGASRNPEVLDHYGEVMIKLDRCKEAIEAWETALEYDTENSELKEKINSQRKNCE